jgi:hypothetical protein
MTDFRLGTEAVHHHGKQTEPQAVAHFLAELNEFDKLISGNDKNVSQNLAHYNFKKLDNELHKPHNGTPAELDSHLHASAVYKIDGKMQLVFTDDLYAKNDKHNQSKDHTHHAYTIDEKTGKISAVFDIAHTKTGEKVLMRHKESGEPQTTLEKSKSGETTVLQAGGYKEYHTPDHRTIKTDLHQTSIHNPEGPTETYTFDSAHGRIDHNVQNGHGKFEVQGAGYKSVRVDDDGTITTSRTTKDFSTTTYPDGRRVERDGDNGSGNILRIKDAKGMETRMTWGSDQNHPDTITFSDPAQFTTNNRTEMTRVSVGYSCDDMYKSYDEPSKTYQYWRINVNKGAGTVDYHPVSARELDQLRNPISTYEYD